MSEAVGIVALIALMLLAVPYVRRARHPRAKPLAAYMVFVTLVGVGTVVMYTLLILLLGHYGALGVLERPAGVVAFLVVVFVPAFLLGRWQLKQPPRRTPPA